MSEQQAEETPEVENKTPEVDENTATDEAPETPAWDPAKAKEQLSKKNAENRSLRERAKKAEAELEDASKYREMYEREVQKNLRMSIAREFNLPNGLAERLKGSTEEELMADAEELLKLIPTVRVPASRPTPLDGKGRTDDAPKAYTTEDFEQMMF